MFVGVIIAWQMAYPGLNEIFGQGAILYQLSVVMKV
jgi:hypothetical protein